jgi:septal ring factor EnvC (AmiA/AmiB activator)
MSDLITLLKDFLPAEIAIISGIFIYLLLLFKKMAEQFISIAEKQATLAETQAKYIQQRLEVVEKTLGISDKAFDLQEKRIKTLEELDKRRETEITQSQKELEFARTELGEMEHNYQDAIASLDLREQQLKELVEAQHRLEQASRTEAIAAFSHSVQTHLQVAMAYADNLKSELPTDSQFCEQVENVLRAIEATNTAVQSFRDSKRSEK